MAAIAKFISYDGGIAFSDSVLKFQKREGDSKIISLDDIVSLGIKRPQEDADGFIRFQVSDGKRYRLFFEAEQLKEAVQFKRRFDALLAERGGEEEDELAPEPEPEPAPAARGRSPRQKRRPVEEDDGARAAGGPSIFRRWWFWVIIVVLVAAIAVTAFLLLRGGGADDGPAAPVSQPQDAPVEVGNLPADSGAQDVPADGTEVVPADGTEAVPADGAQDAVPVPDDMPADSMPLE